MPRKLKDDHELDDFGRFSEPALLILIWPLGFRVTCYYYRKAYYRAFFLDPPACGVSEGGKHRYRGETAFPFILQNLHRQFLRLSYIVWGFLVYDAIVSFKFDNGFGIGLGSIILTVGEEPRTMASWHAYGGPGYPVLRNVEEALLNRDPKTNQLVGELATRWEQPDKTTLIFTLAPNIKFHNLKPVNGRAFTWQKTLFQWRLIEPERGVYDWTEAERIVKASNNAGVKSGSGWRLAPSARRWCASSWDAGCAWRPSPTR